MYKTGGRGAPPRLCPLRLVLSGAIVFLVAAALWFLVVHDRLEARAIKGLAGLSAEASGYADIRYDSVRVGYLHPTVRISGLQIKPVFSGPLLTIKMLEIQRLSNRSGSPAEVRAQASGIRMPDPAGAGDLRQLIEAVGAPFDLFIDCRYDEDGREFVIRRVEISSPEFGTASAALRIGNVHAASLPLYLFMPNAILFEGATFFYKAKGGGPEWNAPPVNIFKGRSACRDRLRRYFAASFRTAEKAGNSLQAANFRCLSDFVASPRRLSVSAVPERPVPFGRIINADNTLQLMDLLRVRVGANGGAYTPSETGFPSPMRSPASQEIGS